jgi:uncharacterized protein YkwD
VDYLAAIESGRKRDLYGVAFESEVHMIVNQERTKNGGLKPLYANRHLISVI